MKITSGSQIYITKVKQIIRRKYAIVEFNY